MKVVVIQARVGSTRLPRKVMDIAGHTMLAQVAGRAQRARLANEVVVATTDSPADNAIVAECAVLGLECSGDERDVLSRYLLAALAHDAEMVVRVTSDCPLIDPEIIADMRWTVDTREDLEFVRRIFGEFSDNRFAWQEVLQVLAKHPEWTAINHYRAQAARVMAPKARTISIRADADATIGSGHAMRCLAPGQDWRREVASLFWTGFPAG